jgi:branched-chain amino acid transport system ATP-binding protein
LTGKGALHTLQASTRRGNRHRIRICQAASADTVALLIVSGLSKRFNGFAAVSNVSFDVGEGEILGLIGPNGSGKSTIFNCIAGMYRPTAGSIKFAGAEIAGLSADRVCHRGIGRTYQIPRPFRNLTLLENVALSAWFGQHGKTDRASCWQQAEEALRLVGLPSDADTDTLALGAAALKKLELARALATQPRLLLADESLNGLDHAEMEQAADMLQRIRRDRNITIVWVEHIMGVLMRVVDRVVVLDHGEKIFDGAPDAAQSDARVVEVYLGAEAVA